MSSPADRLVPLVQRELAAAAAAEAHDDFAAAWLALERAHVAAQSMAAIHTRVHARMIRLAWRERDLVELLAQVAVLPLAAIASLTGVYPVAAGGRSHRSALEAAGIPEDILAAIPRTATSRKASRT